MRFLVSDKGFEQMVDEKCLQSFAKDQFLELLEGSDVLAFKEHGALRELKVRYPKETLKTKTLTVLESLTIMRLRGFSVVRV